MRRALITGAVAALVATGCAGGGRASRTSPSGPYTRQVQGYLARLASNARGQGFRRRAAGPVYGNLNNGGSSSHSMKVVGGNRYALFGACDNDCSDVDLKIFDTYGNLLMQDVAVDDTPMLFFTANGSGSYRVEVVMAACRRNPCYYGIQLLAR
jgi:hypothetical protein